MKINLIQSLLIGVLLTIFSSSSFSQLFEPNPAGIRIGHAHFLVADIEKHRQIWQSLGGELSGPVIKFPGIYILLKEGKPSSPSRDTTANHVGFLVQSYEHYKEKLQRIGAEFFFDNAEIGQIIAELPGGVRAEFRAEENLKQPIVFHHLHLSALDLEALRAWYVKVFAAEIGERRNLPSAVFPEGRVDFLPAQGQDPLPSQGAAIDHIGFEVSDMEKFAATMKEMGVSFDTAPREIEGFNLSVAFIKDPVGTYIEITEGLANLESD